MKKFLAIFMILVLLSSSALAVDLSSLSFDELVQLQQEINAEIVTRPEWKSVTVPCGVYTGGVEIPVGRYRIRNADGACYVCVKASHEQYAKLLVNETIKSEDTMIGNIEILDGYFIQIQLGSAIFEPFTSLGF